MLIQAVTVGRFDDAINANVRVSIRCSDSSQLERLDYVGITIPTNRWTTRVGVSVPVYYPSAWPDAYIRQDDRKGYFKSNDRRAFIYKYLHGSPREVLDNGPACVDVDERAYHIRHKSRSMDEVEIVLCTNILRHYTVNDLGINLATGAGLSGEWHSNIRPVSFTLVHELCHGIHDSKFSLINLSSPSKCPRCLLWQVSFCPMKSDLANRHTGTITQI